MKQSDMPNTTKSSTAKDKPEPEVELVYGGFGHCIPLAECPGHDPETMDDLGHGHEVPEDDTKPEPKS